MLQPRYPHSCLDSGTLVVALLRKMIINPVFLFSSQAEEWLQVWRPFSRHSRAINSFLTLGSCRTAADPANALALGVQQHLLNLKTFLVILIKSASCVPLCLNLLKRRILEFGSHCEIQCESRTEIHFISFHTHSYPFTSIHTRFHTLDFISHQFTLHFISFHTPFTIHFISFHNVFTIQFTLHFIPFHISFHIFSHSISQVHFTSFRNSLFFISNLFTIYLLSFHIFSQGMWKDMKRCEKIWNDTTVRIPVAGRFWWSMPRLEALYEI